MSRMRIIMVSLLAVFATGAVASAASAHEFIVPCHGVSAENTGKGEWNNSACTKTGESDEYTRKLLAGEVEKVEGIGGESVFQFEYGQGVEVVIACRQATLEGELEAAGASHGKVAFTECRVLNRKGKRIEQCAVKNPIEFSFKDQLVGSPVEEEFKPSYGSTFFTITFEAEGGSCAIAFTANVEGTWKCELPSAGTMQIKHEMVCQATGSDLEFAGKKVEFESTESVELKSGEKWAIE